MPDQPSESPVPSSPTAGGVLSPEEKFLRAVIKVMRDRAMYPQNHPQILASISHLQDAVKDLFGERQERTFVFIGDQAFVDDRLMANAQGNLSDVARIFLERRVEALILRQGLPWEELQSFIDYLETFKAEGAQRPAFRAPHMEIGALSASGRAGAPVTPIVQDLGVAVSKLPLKDDRFTDEAKIMQDIFTDWNAAQEMLVSLVDRIMQNLEKGLFENFQSFIPLGALKSYDEYTYVHAINLAILTMALAESLGFPKDSIHAYGVAALLHDVGKTQIPAHILNKQGKLTPEETAEMQKHPVRGATVLLQYPEIPRVAAIVAYEHHLKYDGTGYPAMKRQRTQHIASRLTALADQFDAMRSNRPYREALSPEKIFELMQEGRGTGLDPEMLDHFIAFMKQRKII